MLLIALNLQALYCNFKKLNRLVIFLDKHNIINPNQFAFRSNSRTTDSIFVLQQLIHKAFDRIGKLHVAFIEYQKAFD